VIGPEARAQAGPSRRRCRGAAYTPSADGALDAVWDRELGAGVDYAAV
jgi:hypothetical protein